LPILGLNGACVKHKPLILKNVEDCIRKDHLFVEKETYHIVKKGETLYGISKAYGLSLEEIVEINGIKDPSQVSVGQMVIIPGRTASGLIWPVKGKVSSPFGRRGLRGFHPGIDITAPKGTPIRAVADGLVVESGRKLDGYSGYGKIIVIQHGNGMKTLYAHNKKNLVKPGRCVKAGDIIGEVGTSGNATGSHLHFEIRKNGRPVNPLKYLH
jgi:murein DD-endopeptidase MepM/ murein hydrolase activator NlpD